jgi:hypothetical protein
LKQRIVELEAKNAELEAEKAELLKRIMEENTRRDVRVEELEQKNKELETRLAIVEQASLPVKEQLYNDNPSDNSTSNFNSVAEYHEKPLVDVETDNSFPEEVCYNKQELVATVPANSAKRLNGTSLEEKDMDSFLLEAHKKIVSSEIKQRNKEKKFLRKSANQDVTFGNAYVSETVVVAPQLVIADTPQEEIPTVDSKVTHDIKAVNRYPENSYEDAHRMSLEISEEFEKTVPSGNDQSHVTSVKPDLEVSMEQDDEQESLDKNQIIEQGLIQELCGTFDTCSPISSDDNISSTNTNSSCNGSENMISGSAQHLSYLFDTAIKSGQQEILDWYNYSLEFESRVDALTADGRIKDKTARSKIYKEMKPFLPAKITQDNLRKKTLRARKHLTLFGKNGVGIDKIKLVSYSATEISKLTNAQIQNVIDQVKKYISDHQCHVTLKTVPSGNDQIKDEMSTSASVSSASQSKPDHSYFRNKILDQYPNLYRECSIENFDYYGITDETTCGDYICPLCKLGHDDEEIEGTYNTGSYFIKCEQREIEIVA